MIGAICQEAYTGYLRKRECEMRKIYLPARVWRGRIVAFLRVVCGCLCAVDAWYRWLAGRGLSSAASGWLASKLIQHDDRKGLSLHGGSRSNNVGKSTSDSILPGDGVLSGDDVLADLLMRRSSGCSEVADVDSAPRKRQRALFM